MTEFVIKEEQHTNLIRGLSKHGRELKLCWICGGTTTAAKRENPAGTQGHPWSVIDPDSEYGGQIFLGRYVQATTHLSYLSHR
jgi:hypothetical protein